MKDIMNAKFNFIGDIKFNWINYYDIYKSFINAIKRSRIPNFISENAIENFEHNIDSLYTVTMIPGWSLSTTVLEHYVNPDIKEDNWNIIAVYPENNSLKLSVILGNFDNRKFKNDVKHE